MRVATDVHRSAGHHEADIARDCTADACGAGVRAIRRARRRAEEGAGRSKNSRSTICTITEAEERQIGEDVSAKIRAALRRRAGSGDPQVRHAASGRRWRKQSERPNLNWTFIVLDTDGVNAFASPGGFVHVTRGALGLAKNEAELAGVLGHEIGHVAHKHTVNAIKKSKAVKMGNRRRRRPQRAVLSSFANQAYDDGAREQLRSRRRARRGQGRRRSCRRRPATRPRARRLSRRGSTSATRTRRSETGCLPRIPRPRNGSTKIQAGGRGVNEQRLVEPRFKSNVKYEPRRIDLDCRRHRRVRRPAGSASSRRKKSPREGRAEEEGIRPRRHEADRRAREAEHAGVGVRRRPRTRRGPRRQGRQQSGDREGRR